MLAAQIFEQLEQRIERIEMQLMAMKQLQGATRDALKEAKKAIAKRAKTLRKAG
jgi:chaperonin cofactor prefoldin